MAAKKREEMKGQPSRRLQCDIAKKEGTTWNRKATDRRKWKALIESYILQWMDTAWVKGQRGKQQTEDKGRHWWRATSCSGWTKPRCKVKQEINRQRPVGGIDGGLHPAVDGQSLGKR